MAEYCEYMWDPSRHGNYAIRGGIYKDYRRFDKGDKKQAIKTVRCILRDMPSVDLKHCTDEYITRFLLARKYRTDQAAALIAAYQAQIAHRQDIFGNLTARDPAIQRALRAGIPGVLPARDKKGRCILIILASQWDPIAVPSLAVQRALFFVLETLIQDPRNQQSGFVAVVDWSGFSLRQGGALGATAVRNLIAALRGRFPARFKAIHFLSAPLYVQATLAFVKPFLDDKTRGKIHLHGNNMTTLHQHLPTDILPAELGGTGPGFNPGLWAEPVIHTAMKEAELAAIKRDKELADIAFHDSKVADSSGGTKSEKDTGNEAIHANVTGNAEDHSRSNGNQRRVKTQEMRSRMERKNERLTKEFEKLSPTENVRSDPDGRTDDLDNGNDEDDESLGLQFEMVPRYEEGEGNFCSDVRIEKTTARSGKGDPLPEEANLIT